MLEGQGEAVVTLTDAPYGDNVLRKVSGIPEGFRYALNDIVLHAMKRKTVDKGDRKTGRPESVKAIKELEENLNRCIDALDCFSGRDKTRADINIEHELEPAFLCTLFGVKYGSTDHGYPDQCGYETAYQRLCEIRDGVTLARGKIEKYQKEWHKTALPDTVKKACNLVIESGNKPTSHTNNIAFILLKACLEEAGIYLSKSALSNAIKAHISPKKTPKKESTSQKAKTSNPFASLKN